MINAFKIEVTFLLDWNQNLVSQNLLSAGWTFVSAQFPGEHEETVITHDVLARLEFYQLIAQVIWRLLARFMI